jgi:hypothetical protein
VNARAVHWTRSAAISDPLSIRDGSGVTEEHSSHDLPAREEADDKDVGWTSRLPGRRRSSSG